jgi:hypothetical protein
MVGQRLADARAWELGEITPVVHTLGRSSLGTLGTLLAVGLPA